MCRADLDMCLKAYLLQFKVLTQKNLLTWIRGFIHGQGTHFSTNGHVIMYWTNRTEGQWAWQLADHEWLYSQVCFVWLNFVIMAYDATSWG
jgi:hypothetical protein